jgi:hypothetical protein
MRKTNWRLAMTGILLIVFAMAFTGMGTMAKQSNDAVAMMQTVGTVSGAVGALGAAMTVIGLIGRRRPPDA